MNDAKREGVSNQEIATASSTNGAALAAFFAAGIGAFAMGFVIILNEIGIFTAPSLYEPAGGVTGRTATAVVIWLIAWGILHSRWKQRAVDARRIFSITLVLIAVGILLSFPPVWGLL
ncbi:MAG TPA: hypothetical protein VFO52_13345 [Longimicrobiales bacterium]|nr:hypothetical protein [Longimicrobiales bacterium]